LLLFTLTKRGAKLGRLRRPLATALGRKKENKTQRRQFFHFLFFILLSPGNGNTRASKTLPKMYQTKKLYQPPVYTAPQHSA
jgi:hypothetical protein